MPPSFVSMMLPLLWNWQTIFESLDLNTTTFASSFIRVSLRLNIWPNTIPEYTPLLKSKVVVIVSLCHVPLSFSWSCSPAELWVSPIDKKTRHKKIEAMILMLEVFMLNVPFF